MNGTRVPMYELTTLGFRPGRLKEGLPALRQALAATVGESLLGLWTTEVGDINQAVVLRSLPPPVDSASQPGHWVSAVPEDLASVHVRSLAPLPFAAVAGPGSYGPLYEMRVYQTMSHSLPETIEAWREPFARRRDLSICIGVMHSLEEGAIDFIQLWAYRDFAHRARVRQQASADGTWPPPGSSRWRVQNNTLLVPDRDSPLQ